MERQFAAGDGWRVCARPCGGVARAAPACPTRGGGGVAVVCDGFEGRFDAGVSHEWGERRARLGEPVGVEGSIFVGFDVEEVCAADGERAVFVGELDHFLGRVGGVAGGDACGVAVFVWDHVAFLELAECGPFPGAARPVGDVLAVARCACGVVVCVRGHLCSPSFSRLSFACRAARGVSLADALAYMLGAAYSFSLARVFLAVRLISCVNSKKWGTRRGLCFLAGALMRRERACAKHVTWWRRWFRPCGPVRSGTCCGRCRGRPSCSRGGGMRCLLRGLRRPRFRRGIVRRRRCC